MPADTSLSDRPSDRHGDGNAPYSCHAWATPPGAAWAIDYSYCRHSLDDREGHADRRCPADCQHKAPPNVVSKFARDYAKYGAVVAADVTKAERSKGCV